MKALVVVAHGSRRQASNDEVRELTASMASHDSEFDKIFAGFLELAEPSIPDAIRQAAAEGAGEIVVMPYFLSAGRHVAQDIPEEIDSVRGELADIEIRLAPYLGKAEAITELLLKQAQVDEDQPA